MRSRYKYILLLVIVTGGSGAILQTIWMSEWGRRELAWYRAYPYQKPTKHIPRPPETTPDALPGPALSRQSSPSPSTSALTTFPVSPSIPSSSSTSAPLAPTSLPPSSSAPSSTVKTTGTADPELTQQRSQDNSSHGSATSLSPSLAEITVPPSAPVSRSNLSPQAIFHKEAERGYAAYRRGDYTAAAQAFNRALRVNPRHTELKTQLAYSYKHLGQNEHALIWFKAAIEDHNTAAPFYLRREVEELSNRWSGGGYLIYRDQNDPFGPLTGANLVQSQGGAELAWHPPQIGVRNGRKLHIYGRLLWALEDRRIDIIKDSYQAGIGLRFKPLREHNLVLSAERLVAVGDFARDDWMLRAGYSLDHGTDWREGRGWWTGSLYLDAALIRPQDPDIFLTLQGYGGYNYKLSAPVVLRPQLLVHATWQRDRFRTADLIEAGPGLALKYYFNDTRYEAFRSHAELIAGYRFRLAGTSLGGSGPVLRLLLHF
ncbi:NfrA family protein [Luteithermobacter gelatinilyticus]|uniref:NfrA family protein n=1 Tax=Luteithermobacter gelatinilyticus TaxID=2582913 RepID=UPI00110654AB|nr:tetratricopeptide repeat protein [Luteithermobacter gelatinilyticus]